MDTIENAYTDFYSEQRSLARNRDACLRQAYKIQRMIDESGGFFGLFTSQMYSGSSHRNKALHGLIEAIQERIEPELKEKKK